MFSIMRYPSYSFARYGNYAFDMAQSIANIFSLGRTFGVATENCQEDHAFAPLCARWNRFYR